MSTSKGIERLKTVLPANQKALQKASRSGDIPNISTEICAETPAFNSESLASEFQAQAAMNAEHLNLAAAMVQQGPQSLRQMRQDLEPTTNTLRSLRLPDTKVNVEGIKIEVPFEVKQYALEIDQDKYMKIIWGLLGKERVVSFRKHSTKANQNTTPALWLNQMISVETQKPYVYNIKTNCADAIAEQGLADISVELQQQASDYLEMALGATLRSRLNQIAGSNGLPLFVIFVMIVDEILQSHTEVNIPMTASSLWDDPYGDEVAEVTA